jgi:hypothetical protein
MDKMEEQVFLVLLYKSMQESVRQIQQTLGRPPSSATREEALKQVAMLKAAKDSANREQK